MTPLSLELLRMVADLSPGQWKVMRTTGVVEVYEQKPTIASIKQHLHCDALDTVNLRDASGRHTGVAMLVDDIGSDVLTTGLPGKNLPVNEGATRLYHAQCVPGTTHQIRGDVALCCNEDFAP